MADWPWPVRWDPSASHFVANETFSHLALGDSRTAVCRVSCLDPGPGPQATSSQAQGTAFWSSR